MAMIEIDRDPSQSALRWFGLLMLLFFCLVGGIVYLKTETLTVSAWLGGLGVVLCALYYVVPGLRRPLYLGWMYAALPIGWVVSHLLLAAVYYLVLTPIGLLMRLFGWDPMARRLDPGATSYWVAHEAAADRTRYFRQF